VPTYEYLCTECGTNHDIVQSMADPTLTTCPDCGKETLRKQFSGVGVMFKGSGFYRTDSRESKTDSTPATPKTDSSSATSTPSPAATTTEKTAAPKKSESSSGSAAKS